MLTVVTTSEKERWIDYALDLNLRLFCNHMVKVATFAAGKNHNAILRFILSMCYHENWEEDPFTFLFFGDHNFESPNLRIFHSIINVDLCFFVFWRSLFLKQEITS